MRSDWGPLLHAFFTDRIPDTLSPAQRRYLGALVDNDDLWDPRNGTIGLVLRDAGLPYDRETCRNLTKTPPPDYRNWAPTASAKGRVESEQQPSRHVRQ